MFEKILLATVPTAACERAADMAFALARPSQARLLILHAFGLPEYGWGAVRHLIPSGKDIEIKKEIEAYYAPRLKKVSNYRIEALPGVPDTEILRLARKERSDVIVMGPHGRTEEKTAQTWGMAGSTLEKVSRKARCPVMIVPPNVPAVYAEDDHDLPEQWRSDYHILVVDDEAVMRDSLKEWLVAEGYTVHLAGSGEEALEVLAQTPCQLMLTDIKMPGMDGVTLLEKALRARHDLTVVMMTAYAEVDTALAAMKLGARDYLIKPFDTDKLIPQIEQLHRDYEVTKGRMKIVFSNIVLATDFSAPADCAFDFACNLTQYYGAALHLYHTVPLSPEEAAAGADFRQIEANIETALENMRQKYGEKLRDLTHYTMDAWEGVPHLEILKYARWQKADLIIMAHHSKERDPEKASLGSNVIKVARSATCPILSVNRDFMESCMKTQG